MPKGKQPNIQWRETDNTRLTNAVRQFNGKLTRLIKKNPEIAPFLPERINIKDLRSQLQEGTRKEFNRSLNRVQRFYKNKNLSQLKKVGDTYTTKWQLQNVMDDLQIINARRKARLKKFEPSAEKGNYQTIKQLNLKPKKIENLESINWKKFVESVNKQVRPTYELEGWKRHKENYIRTINWDFGIYADDLIPLLEDIAIEKWENIFEADNPDLTFDFMYGPEDVYNKFRTIVESLGDEGIDIYLIKEKYEWEYEI